MARDRIQNVQNIWFQRKNTIQDNRLWTVRSLDRLITVTVRLLMDRHLLLLLLLLLLYVWDIRRAADVRSGNTRSYLSGFWGLPASINVTLCDCGGTCSIQSASASDPQPVTAWNTTGRDISAEKAGQEAQLSQAQRMVKRSRVTLKAGEIGDNIAVLSLWLTEEEAILATL